MRIGIGKKIGGVYVGTSVSTKTAINWLSMLFLWPFYLMYYICIWPFVAIIKAISKSNKKNKNISNRLSQVQSAEAQNYLRILQESAKICSETKNPDTFFSRLDLCFEMIEKLKPYKNLLNDEGKNLYNNMTNLNAAKVSSINEFVDCYAKETRIKIYNLSSKKAKENKVNAFRKTLAEYNDKMEKENVEYYTRIANEMMNIVD